MSIDSLQDFLDRLEGVKPSGGGQYKALCPAHSDNHHSLSVKESNEKILVHCFKGCPTKDIVEAIGLIQADLFLGSQDRSGAFDVVETYDYVNADNELVFQVVRTEDKQFPQRRFDEEGRPVWGLSGGEYKLTYGNWYRLKGNDNPQDYDQIKEFEALEERPLYNLPTLLKAIENGHWVVIVEGEKDVNNLGRKGIVGTTNPQGTNQWKEGYTQIFKAAKVAVIPDNDRPGVNHAYNIANSLSGTAKTVKKIEFPEFDKVREEHGEDVTDWFENCGGTKEKLWDMIQKVPEWEGEPPPYSENGKLDLSNSKEKKSVKPAKKKGGRKATYYRMAIDVDPEDLQDAPTFPKKIAKDLPVIGKYVSWIDDNTETPASFAFAAFKNQLGLLLGRRIKTAYGQTDHYPIFYDGLIGESALSRKSSTIKVANKIMQKATSIQGEKKDYMVIPGVGSAEGVLKKIEGSQDVIQGQHAKALLKLDEMSVLTDKLSQSSTQTFISRLNELWDVPPEVINPTISNPIELEKPTVSLLAGSTAENLKGAWEERAIEGGFFNRFCWWTSSELKIEPEAEKMPKNIENEIVKKVQGVVDFAKKLEDHEFVKNEEAQERFKEWYTEWRKKLQEKDQTNVVIARIPDQVIRHALLFSVILGESEITLETLEKAIKMGNYLQKTAYHVLERFTETSTDKLKKRVFTILNERGEVKKGELSEATSSYRDGVRELNMLLTDLEELEIIEATEGA